MSKLNIYLGIKNNFIRKVVLSKNKTEAKKELEGFLTLKLKKNTWLRVTSLNDRNFMLGKCSVIMSNDKKSSLVNPVNYSDNRVRFGSRVFETPNFDGKLLLDKQQTWKTNYLFNGKNRYIVSLEVGDDLGENWKILQLWNKDEFIEMVNI
jgi:hypothetical protein